VIAPDPPDLLEEQTRIALVGDYNAAVVAHQAIPRALSAAAEQSGARLAWDWIHTRAIGADASALLEPYAAVWCVPGSPYANTAGALAAIRFARESGRPFLGTCGGFQHLLLEYAKAVWQVEGPAHAELDPGAIDPLIAPLACSLIDVSGVLHIVPGTRLADIYATESATEAYHCRYGLNPLYAGLLEDGPLRACARDPEGGVRAIELSGHPFFIGALFQPERAALQGRTPELVAAFVVAAAESRAGGLRP